MPEGYAVDETGVVITTLSDKPFPVFNMPLVPVAMSRTIDGKDICLKMQGINKFGDVVTFLINVFKIYEAVDDTASALAWMEQLNDAGFTSNIESWGYLYACVDELELPHKFHEPRTEFKLVS